MQDEERKLWLYRGAIAFAALTAGAAFCRPEGAWPLMLLAVACVLAANIDKIGDLRASGAGFQLELTRRAETAVAEIGETAGRIGALETNMQQLLAELETKTADLVGHITGGESYPLVRVLPKAGDERATVIVEVVGKYSLRDVSMRLVDAAEDDPRAAAGTSVDLGFIAARTFRQLPDSIFDSVRRSEEGRLDIFFSVFNGVMYQLLDYRKAGGRWRFASCVLAHGRVYKHIDPDFGPQPDWEAERVRLRIDLEHEPSGRIL
jgi:hypothetical protein